MSKLRSRVQKIANQNPFLFIFRRSSHSKAIFPATLLVSLGLDLRVPSRSDIVAKTGWFEVEIKLNRLDKAVISGLVGFKQKRRLSACLPDFSNALKWHDNFM